MPGLMLNEDDSHFYCCFPAEMLNKEGIYALVDHYDSSGMKELIFNVNAARANYPSRVWQTVWEGFDPAKGLEQPRIAALPAEWRADSFKMQCKLMNLDIPLHWIDRVRQRGKSPWLSVRMNDVHDVDNPDLPHHADFWKNHPEYWRVPDPNRFTAWTDRAFDYGHGAVRDHFLNLIRELFERYDFDGLELDWMRFQLHFKPGFEEEGRKLLIQFHRDVRALADQHAKRRGHPIKIGVRVPSRPWTARAIGLDAVAWAKEKLVDLVVITPFWATIEFDMPVEYWRELLGPDILLAAGLEINLRPSGKVWPKYGEGFSNTPETVFGAAASLLHRGADRIYLFNYYLSPKDPKNKSADFDYPGGLKAILDYAGDPAALLKQPRRHVVTYSDVVAPGEPEAFALPAKCALKNPARFRIPIGPKPNTGTAQICIGLGEEGNLDTSPLEVYVNETKCPPTSQPLPAPIHPVVKKTIGFEIPPGVLHDGYNYVEVNSSTESPHQLFWTEIMLRP